MLSLPPPPSKQPRTPVSSDLEAQNFVTNKSSRTLTLRQPTPERTNPIIWCAAVLCLIFSLLLIFSGVITLIFYIAIKPRNPIFDIPNATLNVVHFDSSTQYFNADFTLLTNISNPNRRIDVRFESLDIELFFSERIISSQLMKPFTQKARKSSLQTVNLISSLVFLPQDVGVKIQRQVQSNKVVYNVRGTFKVRVNIGLIHWSYWLHSRCQIEMTGPPTGVLVSRQCITKR